MADEQIVTSIVAKADLSSLVAEVHKATASLQSMQQSLASAGRTVASQVKVINNSFGETLRSTGQFSSHFVTLNSDVEKFGKGLDAGRLKLRDYYGAFAGHAKQSGGLIRELAKQQVMLQNAVMQPIGRNAQGLMQYNVHIPRGLDLVKNKTKLAAMELQIMNRAINEGATSLINWGKNTQWAGRQLTVGLTLPLAGFGAAAAKAFREADQELTRLTKVYGDIAGSTAAELGKVRSEITQTSKELATGMGVSFKETISLAADIAATGKTGNELLGSLKETTRLAVLGEVDRQEAMKATLAIQSAFKQDTDELAKSINFLNAVENQTSTTLNDLVEAIPKAGPVIKGLGGSVQDLALYLTAMREGGINASEGANALKSALASLINPTDVAVGKFKSFGIDLLGIVQGNAGNVTGTLLELQAALDKLDPLSKQQAIEQLFGKFQFSRLNALFENLGKQGSQTLQVLDLMKASAGDLEKLAGRELAAVTESASGKYRRAIEGLRAELAVVGEDFLDIGTKFLNVVTKLLKFLNDLPDPVKKLVVAFGGLTAVAGPLIMLTGLLANFAGYVLKGATNLKALLSGQKGWKMLTPEIAAAEHAAKTLGDTFYSDARAAAVLEQALRNLVDEFAVLKNAVSTGSISVAPTISTAAGNVIMEGGGPRIVDPNNPLVGEQDTRAFSHINPRKSGFAGQLFGVVPGAVPVNRKIGATPQIFMKERLPNIEGVTSVGGVSTGIVAEEAAKFHAMMATLGMQTKSEVNELKRVIATGGTISSDLLNTYDDLLPITSKFAMKASEESALIVAELRAAKITVDEAKRRILVLNSQIEAGMMQEVSTYAASQGRSIDFSKAPLIDQPVVDASGKYTLRDLFKRPSTKNILNEFGRLRGVRSFGAPYTIETTQLKKFNAGGSVVPGPNVNSDVVPAMLTPGEFVVNREATARNLPLLMAINGGAGSGGPGFNDGGFMPARMLWQGAKQNMILAHPEQAGRRSSLGLSPGSTIPGSVFANDFIAMQKRGIHPAGLMYDIGTRLGYSPKEMRTVFNQMNSQLISRLNSAGNITPQEYDKITNEVVAEHLNKIRRQSRALGRVVSLQQEMETLGFSRGARRGIVPGSLRQFGFDGQRIPQPFVSTGGGMPAGMAEAHFARMQELFPESERQASPGFGSRRSFRTLFGVERGHVGSSLPFAGASRNIGLSGPSVRGSAVDSHGRNAFLGMPLRRVGNKWVKFGFDYDPFKEAMNSRMRFSPRLFRNRGGLTPGYSRGGGMATTGRMFYGQNQPPYLSAAYMTNRIPVPEAYSSPRASLRDRLTMSGWLPGRTSSPLNYDASGNLYPGPAPKTMGMGRQMVYGSVGSMGGFAAGNAVGGQLGGIIGSLAGGFLPQLIMGIKNASGGAMGLVKILKSLTIPGAVLTALTIIGKKLLDYKKHLEDVGKANRLAFGGTEESFASVGVKGFQQVSDRIKDINEQLELHKAQVKSTYESYTQAGPKGAGLTLTITQLREAIKNAKESQKDYVEAFNNVDSSKVVEYAAQLKSQFVAMGMSAQDATNQIYAIVRASEKASQALSAITSKDFVSITDQVSGIKFMLQTLKNELNSGDFNAEEFNRGLDTLLNSVMKYRDYILTIKKDNKLLYDDTTSLKKVMEDINKMAASRREMSKDQIDSLKNENIIYANILSNAESLESVTAKILLYQEGFADVLNLSSMTGKQALGLMNNLVTIQSEMNQLTEEVGNTSKNPLLPLAQLIDKTKKESDAASNAVKKLKKIDEDYYEKKIDNINKTIKALEKERDARLKALDVQQDAQSYEVSLSQAQIRYKQAIATGDLALAAQEQLGIEQLVSDRQRQLTRDRINEVYDAKIEKLQNQIEALRNELKAAQDSYTAKTSAATNKSAELATLQKYRDDLERVAIRNIGKETISETDKQEVSNIIKAMKDAGGEVAKAAFAIESQYKTTPEQASKGTTIASNIIRGLQSALSSSNAGNTVFLQAVNAFKLAVEKFAGSSIGGPVDPSKITTIKPPGAAAGVITRIPTSELTKNNVSLKKGTVFETTDGKKYEITGILGSNAVLKKRQMGGAFAAGERVLVGERGAEVVEFNRGGRVYPNLNTVPGLGVPNSSQNLLDKFIHRAKYLENVNLINGSVSNPYANEVGSLLNNSQGAYAKSLQNGTMSSGAMTTINMTNTYNMPDGMSKQEVGQYIVDLQKKELSKLGIVRSY